MEFENREGRTAAGLPRSIGEECRAGEGIYIKHALETGMRGGRPESRGRRAVDIRYALVDLDMSVAELRLATEKRMMEKIPNYTFSRVLSGVNASDRALMILRTAREILAEEYEKRGL